MIAGVAMPCRSTSCGSVDTVADTRFCPAVVPCCKIDAGISGLIPASSSPAQMSRSALTPIRNTSVPPVFTSAAKSRSRGCPARLCPVMMCSDDTASRWVTGMPLYAGTEIADGTPGTTSNGIPCCASSSSSSPPRPNKNGSPPLSRTTVFPSCALVSSRRLMSACGRVWFPARLPTSISSAESGSCSSRLVPISRS